MNNLAKAEMKRAEGTRLKAESKADLARARKLAYTDIEAANELADQARDKAIRSREAFAAADDYEEKGIAEEEKAAKDKAAAEDKAAKDKAAAEAKAAKDKAAAEAKAAKDKAAAEAAAAKAAKDEAAAAAKAENKEDNKVPPPQLIEISASYASAAYNAVAGLYQEQIAAAASRPSIEFIQNNTSPEALSPAEIYRQTNNAISRVANSLVAA